MSVDLAAVMAHVRSVIATVEPADSPDTVRAVGGEVRSGDVRLTGPGSADVAGQEVRFVQAVIATGADPTLPDVPGLREADPLTSDTVWDLDALPGRLAILGGGAVGCELGQAFARLGAEVDLVEAADRLLPGSDPAVDPVLRAALTRDGVRVRTGAEVTRVADGALHLADGARVPFDRLLVATGRTPRTAGLGLEAAGVEVDERGCVVVDEHLRTTHPRIWAAGDVTPHPRQTHVAGTHGSLAASNAVLGVRRSVGSPEQVARVVYTDPEVATVGVPTATADRVLHLPHDEVDRAIAESRTEGLTRLAVDRRGRLVGATIVGPRAGETLGEVSLAVSQGLTTRDLAGLVHPYPTWNDGPWNAVLADLRETLARPALQRPMRAAVSARRWWLTRRG